MTEQVLKYVKYIFLYLLNLKLLPIKFERDVSPTIVIIAFRLTIITKNNAPPSAMTIK